MFKRLLGLAVLGVSLLPGIVVAGGINVETGAGWLDTPVLNKRQNAPVADDQDGLTVTTEWGARCVTRTIPITVEATRPDNNLTVTSYGHDLFFALAEKEIVISGTYNVSTRLCTPRNTRTKSIQFLAHGATYSKLMWDFAYQPSTYSWTRHMNLAGYPTFAIDLIGAGNSSRPDALRETQTATFVEQARQLVGLLKSGAVDGTRYNRVVYVGYSIGAVVGNSLATQHPGTVDVLVLLGMCWFTPYQYPVLLMLLMSNARDIDAGRWGAWPNLYTTMPTRLTRDFSHLYGDFDPAVSDQDYRDQDTNTIGEAMTFSFHIGTAPEYEGPVFLGIGGNDLTFCGRSCEGKEQEVYQRFPKARDHEPHLYPQTGHALLLHRQTKNIQNDVLRFVRKHDRG